MLYGVAYYAEYQPYDRLERDLDLMAEADLTVIRVGESVWSTWEPEDGHFSLDWLEPVLDGAHQRGISVILGTPTYAMPPWLARKYPEVRAERRTGERIPYGHRQDADYSHPAFRFHADRVVRQVVGRYVDHPAIIGYQVDNEPGMELFHNHGAFETFVDRLRERYGDAETLSDRWGLVYWSHRLSRWDDLWVPDGNTVPSYDLAWRRFQSELTTEFISAQTALVKELARPDQFVTTCMALSRPAFDAADLNRDLDIAAVNPYYPMQAALTMPEPPAEAAQARPRWNRQAGASAIYLQADLTRAARDQSFLVTETNAMAIGEPHSNFPAYDGQWRQAAWALVARGARMVEYWHWHSIHYGHESYWLGVVGQRGARALLRRGRADRRRHQARRRRRRGPRPGRRRRPPVLRESRWAMEFHSPLPVEGGLEPDPGAYDRIVGRFYDGLFGAGLQADIVYPQHLGSDADALVARWPVLVVPALYIADDMLLDLLDGYARAGGHLVLGFRSGYADDEARPRAEVMPGRLREAVGASYGEYTNLAVPVPLRREPWLRTSRRCDRDGMGGRARPRGRRDPRALRAPAPRSLGGGHHQPARPGTGDLRGHPARPPAGRRAGALAASRPRRLGGPARDGHRHERPQPRGGAAALRVELVVGTDELGVAGGGARPAVRDGPYRGEDLDLAAWDIRVLLESPRENNEEDSP